jgi:hypothetical protein
LPPSCRRAAHPPLDYPSLDNVGETYDVLWLTFTSGCAAQNNLFGDQKFWRTKYLEAYKKHIPFKSLRFGVTFAACATANRCAKKSLLSQAKL